MSSADLATRAPAARSAPGPEVGPASWLVGDDGTTLHADTRCRRLLGLEPNDVGAPGLRGLTVWTLVAAEDHDRLLGAFRSLLTSYDNGPTPGLPLRLRRPDGGHVEVSARLSPVLDDRGERHAWLLELTPGRTPWS